MKTKLIRIGNSQGVRIPKPIIKEIGLSGEIEMILKDNKIILRSAEQTRKGWDNAFKKMAEENDDQLIDKEGVEAPSQWDKTEWTW
ncbi:AbrB/MazE/SpoVT family DNA-binding domain-containing protein [Fodinibius sp. AD559]|uniref:AbrB/MazE/SpoVT family DNA-binding domain-containing protein n=1 Tax=Fodinibius sp. AD559 TaxID=3424179 RepID=UPI004046E685